MPPPLRDMLPLAAAATECQLTGLGTSKRRINPSKRHPCTVRVVYGLLELGGSRTSRPLHHLQVQHDEDAARSFDRTFLLDDPMTFSRSRSACRDEIHRMLTRTPALRDFDLAAANWDGGFLPDDLAGTITERARLDEEDHGGDARRFSLDLTLAVFVRAVCSEAKALALACREAAAQCGLSVADRCCCCCICQDQDIAAAEGGGDGGTLRLPCSHTFHVRCLARWFETVTTCPLCRRDMVVHLEAVYTLHTQEQGRNRETKGPIQVSN